MAPAFDFDCSLYSCVEDLDNLIGYKCPALPYCSKHKEQLDLIYSVSDVRLKLSPFDINKIMDNIWEEKHQIGKHEIKKYLESVLINGPL